MDAVDLVIAASFFEEYRPEVNAIAYLVLAFGLAQAVDRTLARRGRQITQVMGAQFSPVVDTRLRLIRRLITSSIFVVGIAFALSGFENAQRVATGVLASSAVLGIVVGFAARQTLANAVAGIGLAITQPVRIGDLVTFEERTGIVEDIRLTYTYIRAGDGRRVIVPNERLAQSTIENHTIIDPRVNVDVSLWMPRDTDTTQAMRSISDVPDVEEVRVADVERDGIRLVVRAWAEYADTRVAIAAFFCVLFF